MTERKTRILVVDDEETLCEALRYNLEAEGYDVDVAYSAEQVLGLDITKYNLILLDIMLGAMSGTELAARLKSNPATSTTPIIFCTARDNESDMIDGLNLGADDYIAKPYSIANVLARVKAVLRRTDNTATVRTDSDCLVYENLVIDRRSKLCLLDGKDLKMPRKEYELLLTFLENRGKIFSRSELLLRIWPDEVVVLQRVIDVHINRMRTRLGALGKHIVTRSGYGYGFID